MMDRWDDAAAATWNRHLPALASFTAWAGWPAPALIQPQVRQRGGGGRQFGWRRLGAVPGAARPDGPLGEQDAGHQQDGTRRPRPGRASGRAGPTEQAIATTGASSTHGTTFPGGYLDRSRLKTAYPTREHRPAVYAVDRAACQPNWASPGPHGGRPVGQQAEAEQRHRHDRRRPDGEREPARRPRRTGHDVADSPRQARQEARRKHRPRAPGRRARPRRPRGRRRRARPRRPGRARAARGARRRR